MKLDVIKEKENPLLDRRELVVKITYAGPTPPRSEIREKLIAKLSANSKTFILGPLGQRYGSSEAIASVKIYKKRERALQIERPHIIRKNFPEEKPPAEKKVEEPPKEAGKEPAKTEDAAATKEKAPEVKEEVKKDLGKLEEKVAEKKKPEKITPQKPESAEAAVEKVHETKKGGKTEVKEEIEKTKAVGTEKKKPLGKPSKSEKEKEAKIKKEPEGPQKRKKVDRKSTSKTETSEKKQKKTAKKDKGAG